MTRAITLTDAERRDLQAVKDAAARSEASRVTTGKRLHRLGLVANITGPTRPSRRSKQSGSIYVWGLTTKGLDALATGETTP